jgi:hypothetical protein
MSRAFAISVLCLNLNGGFCIYTYTEINQIVKIKSVPWLHVCVYKVSLL